MKEFIEKMISRLEEKDDDCGCGKIDVWEAISIVNQLAEEYNNGWIPVSERLPEEKPFGDSEHTCSDGVLITVKHDRGTTVGMGCLTRGHWFYLKGATEIDVIAWKPLPTPYKEGAEQALAEMKGEK